MYSRYLATNQTTVKLRQVTHSPLWQPSSDRLSEHLGFEPFAGIVLTTAILLALLATLCRTTAAAYLLGLCFHNWKVTSQRVRIPHAAPQFNSVGSLPAGIQHHSKHSLLPNNISLAWLF